MTSLWLALGRFLTLHKLKYCNDIMFLTINHVRNFDEVILSRIHLMLKYHELHVGVRSQIWKHMLHRAHTSQEEAIIALKNMERLIITTFNDRQVSLLCGISEISSTDQPSLRSRTWLPSLMFFRPRKTLGWPIPISYWWSRQARTSSVNSMRLALLRVCTTELTIYKIKLFIRFVLLALNFR